LLDDARRLAEGSRIGADCCIVGAGAAGITIARRLAGTGIKVLIVESGSRRSGARQQAFAAAECLGQPYFPVEETRLRRFGGTTGWWNGECRPLDGEEDLGPRPWLGHRGWPIAAAELQGRYLEAGRLCGIGSVPLDPAEPWFEAAGETCLPLPAAQFRTRVFGYSRALDFARAHGPVLDAAGNIRVLLNATATRLATAEDGRRVTAIDCATLGGIRFTVDAKVVVLATGGIENARLLLASNDRLPAGLGNGGDQVGRCFMEHLFFDDVASFLPARSLPALGLYARRRRTANGTIKAALMPTAASLAGAGLPNLCFKFASALKRRPGIDAAMQLRDCLRSGFPPSGRGRLLRDLVSDGPASALALWRYRGLRDLHGPAGPRPLLVTVVAEQLPDPASRVTLGQREDALGQKLARLDWRLTERDRTAWREGLDLLGGALAAAGLGRIEPVSDPQAALARVRGGRHHMGTTRMAESERGGVVDADCRVFGQDNLFCAGSSVFPTAGHANPTLTILALALRLADRLEARLEGGP
jgi:choline dehydrogenase-like flavoprotein